MLRRKMVICLLGLTLAFSLNTNSKAADEVIGDEMDNQPVFQELTDEQKEFVEKTNNDLAEIGNDPKEIEKYMEDNNFDKAEIEPVITPYHHSDVSFTLDYYKNSYNGLYTVIGNWKFAAGKIDTDDSSEDVVGLSLWKTDYTAPSGIVWASYPTRLYVYDSLGSLRVNTDTHYKAQKSGMVWKYQDKYVYNGSEYTGQTGTAVMWATSMAKGTLYGAVNYVHTYKKIGSLSSATISAGSSGVNLSATFTGGKDGKQSFKNQVTITSWPSRNVQ